ncbi:MAG TPA: hypothetical protein VHC69_09585 [Polyangiaceae bacterium]|nr:hypothetical protein [Polyangiaceae bacterium]
MSELPASSRARAAVLAAGSLVFAALGVACGSSGTPANELEQGKTLTVASAEEAIETHVSAEGGHYAQGKNTFLVAFDPSKTVLDMASAFMPVHGHATPAPPTISQTSDGYRISNFIFSMPGIWDVTLDVTLENKSDKVEFTLDVP